MAIVIYYQVIDTVVFFKCAKMKKGKGRKMEVKTKKRKGGGSLLTVLFQFPDFTEDNNLMGGYMTWPTSHKIS